MSFPLLSVNDLTMFLCDLFPEVQFSEEDFKNPQVGYKYCTLSEGGSVLSERGRLFLFIVDKYTDLSKKSW